MKIANQARVDIDKLCEDISTDLVECYDPDVAAQIKQSQSPLELAPGHGWDQYHPTGFESDDPRIALNHASQASHRVQNASVQPAAETLVDAVRQQRLFPNSFKVSGLKHIADNLTGSVLESLPQYPGSYRCWNAYHSEWGVDAFANGIPELVSEPPNFMLVDGGAAAGIVFV